MDGVNIWQNFLNQINDKVSSLSFNTWFNSLKLLAINDEEIVLADPGKAIKDQLTIYYKELIDETLLELTGKTYKLIFKDENTYVPPERMNVIIIRKDAVDASYEELKETLIKQIKGEK